MKKLLLISIISIAFLSSCGNSDNNKDNQKQDATVSESTNNEKEFIKNISYKDFIKKVWDFETDAKEFNYKGERPCVIDFYAKWCGPCKMTTPILEKLAQEYDGKVDFYMIDTDKEQKLTMVLKIQYLPTVFFMKNGAQPEKSVGAKDEDYFRSQINKLLGE